MIYSDKNVPYAFIHNPRTSGTTLTNYFLWRGATRLTDSNHDTYNEASKIFNFDNYYTFGFVRNPFSREVSLYNLVLTNSGRDISFEEWVHSRHEVDNPRSWLVMPQIDYFCDSNREIKANIFKFEDRKDSIRTISDILQFPYEQLINYVPIIDSPKSPPGIDYRSYYTSRTFDILSYKYKIDLDTFGYTFDS